MTVSFQLDILLFFCNCILLFGQVVLMWLFSMSLDDFWHIDQALCLRFWWKWAPSWKFFNYFPYYVICCVNGCFRGTAFSSCFTILSALFIQPFMEGKFSGEHFCGWIFYKYLVLDQSFIKHQLYFDNLVSKEVSFKDD